MISEPIFSKLEIHSKSCHSRTQSLLTYKMKDNIQLFNHLLKKSSTHPIIDIVNEDELKHYQANTLGA